MDARACRLLVMSVALLLLPTTVVPEGFGGMVDGKMVAELIRSNPPEALLPAGRIAIKVTNVSPNDSQLAARLASILEAELLSRDKRLTKATGSADVALKVEINQNGGSQNWETREESQTVERGRDAKGKIVFGVNKVQVRYLRLHYTVGLAYAVTDIRSGVTIDSAAVTAPFDDAYREGNGAPAMSDMGDTLARAAADQILRRLTFSREKISVLIPKGSLKDAGRLAEAGLWNKYLDVLQAMPAKANPKDEAYRVFALGIAYEALGYAADEPETAINYLENASQQYNKALEQNPAERYFREGGDARGGLFSKAKAATTEAPLGRVQAALTKYQRLKELSEALRQAKGSAPVGGASAGKGLQQVGSQVATDAMDNQAVLAMAREELPESVIVSAIRAAKDTNFDVSPNGLIQLHRGGLKGTLLAEIQAAAARKEKGTKVAPKK